MRIKIDDWYEKRNPRYGVETLQLMYDEGKHARKKKDSKFYDKRKQTCDIQTPLRLYLDIRVVGVKYPMDETGYILSMEWRNYHFEGHDISDIVDCPFFWFRKADGIVYSVPDRASPAVKQCANDIAIALQDRYDSYERIIRERKKKNVRGY